MRNTFLAAPEVRRAAASSAGLPAAAAPRGLRPERRNNGAQPRAMVFVAAWWAMTSAMTESLGETLGTFKMTCHHVIIEVYHWSIYLWSIILTWMKCCEAPSHGDSRLHGEIAPCRNSVLSVSCAQPDFKLSSSGVVDKNPVTPEIYGNLRTLPWSQCCQKTQSWMWLYPSSCALSKSKYELHWDIGIPWDIVHLPLEIMKVHESSVESFHPESHRGTCCWAYGVVSKWTSK